MNYVPSTATKIFAAATRNLIRCAPPTYGYQSSARHRQRYFQASFRLTSLRNSDYSTQSAPWAEGDDSFCPPSIAVKVTRNWMVGAYYLHRENSSSFAEFDFHNNQVGLRSTLEF